MKLAFKKLGQGKPLIILHGLYGSSDNWYSIGKALSTNFEVYLVDQRNHGHSPHSESHTYNDLQEDVFEFFNAHNISKAILIGHSMGGKTAMLFSIFHPERIEKLVIVDIAPKAYTSLQNYQSHAIEHLNIMQAFLSTEISQMQSREQIDEEFAKFIIDKNIRQFLLKNVSRSNDGFKWKLNVQALSKALPNILEGLDIKAIQHKKTKPDFPVLFIKGEKSDYIVDDDLFPIKQIFPKAELVTIFDAGHWVHSEQPELFLKTLKYFLEV